MNEPLVENEPIKIGRGEFACPFCSRVMKSTSHMRVHIRAHTGEKPFACELCQFASAQKSDLKKHMRKMHRMEYLE